MGEDTRAEERLMRSTTMTLDIIFATGNRAKIAQLTAVIQGLAAPLRVVSLSDLFGSDTSYEEVGDTPEAIASRGARELALRFALPVITEDTALYVKALADRPGVFAGRYLKAHGRAGLLTELTGVEDREAAIVSAVALATPAGQCHTWVNRLEGEIALTESWNEGLPDWIAPTAENPNGGGFNSLFIPRGCNRTLAALTLAEAMQYGYREANFIQLTRHILAEREV